MSFIRTIAWIIVLFYCTVILLLYALQSKLIFYPGILPGDFKFKSGEELSLETPDRERISALFYRNRGADVILYFHGNAGDLSGWQFVSEDFTKLGFNFLIIDYRGYGKSTGTISEQGFYRDAETAYQHLLRIGFRPDNILIYGRSIGSGVAVDLASRFPCKGLILESPFTSLAKLANEKLPFFFPSLYLKYRFDNLEKINGVECPVILLHGAADTLIPAEHSAALFEKFSGRKKRIVVEGGAHNDLHAFTQYQDFVSMILPTFFK